MGRVERVADDATFGALATRLDDAHREPRRARGDDRVGRSGCVDVGEQLDLEIGPLRPVLLDEVRLRQRLLHVGGELETLHRRLRRQSDDLERLPGLVHVPAQVRFCVRGWIRRDHVEPAREVLRRPTRTDESRPDDRDPAYRFVRRQRIRRHVFSLRLRCRRVAVHLCTSRADRGRSRRGREDDRFGAPQRRSSGARVRLSGTGHWRPLSMKAWQGDTSCAKALLREVRGRHGTIARGSRSLESLRERTRRQIWRRAPPSTAHSAPVT